MVVTAAVAVAAAVISVVSPAVAHAAAPDSPVLVSPADGATADGTSPTLRVTATDPDGGDVSVRFEGRVKGATAPGAGDPFTLVVLPDTQNYTYSNRQGTILQQAQWVVANRAAMNTVFVAHLGDLVSEYTNAAQWERVSAGLKPLDDAAVPTSVIPGNHDFDNATGDFGPYDTWFPVSRYTGKAWPAGTSYGGYLGQNQFGPDPVDRENMNNYALFSAGGTDFLLLNLEWEAPQYALDWADRVLANYPDRTVIMTTHSYVSITGGLRTTAERPGGTAPATIWSSFVSTHCQIVMVLSGHEHSGLLGEARRTDTNSCGRPVQAILTDYQDRPNGGDGWLRSYRFDPSAGTVAATTYSPKLDQYETDADSAFTLPFPFATQTDAPFTPIATVTVPTGGTASTTWPGLTADTAYEWRAVAGDGSTTTTSATWTLRTPASSQVLTDAFRRTVSGGWGNADTGQRWASAAPASLSVDGEWGSIAVPRGSGRTARPTDVLLTDAVVEADLRITAPPSGSGTYVSVLARDAGSVSYRVKFTFRSSGAPVFAVTRNSAGTDTTLASQVLPTAIPAGTTLRVRFEQTGSAPTRLRASAWPAAGTEPAGWMLTATDATAALQTPGGVGLDTYVSSTATGPQTVQVDRFTVTRPGGSPPPPPANAAPTAVIGAPVVSGRTVQFDGRGSTDTDGTVAAWRWSFGDGQSADGATASRTYAADGTYPVTLTVTDDDGATATASTTVTVSAPPPVTDVARDAFARTVSNGWGAADVGGPWTVSGATSRYVVGDGVGRQVLTALGSTAEATLAGARATGVDTRVNLSWNRTAGAGKLYASVVPRVVSSSTDYRASVVVTADGRPTVSLVRRVGGVETRLASVVPPVSVAANTPYTMAVRLTPAGGSTELAVKFWPAGSTEPTAWQATATDGTADLQQAGSVKLLSYLSSSATAPVTTSFDDLVATPR